MAVRRIAGFENLSIAADVSGEGPLVIFVHGFPELRQSWDRLASSTAARGFQSCAMDVRGYGDSDRPSEVADYRMEAIVGDLVAVADELSPDQSAILVGHDWGASIVWNAAMARPDRFAAVAALSIPWVGRADRPFDEIFTRRFTDKGRFFYQAYFQQVGVAEQELEADVAQFLRSFYVSLSGDAKEGDWPLDKPADAKLLDGVVRPSACPDWLDADYFAHAVKSFERTGFAGALNRYRNHQRDYHWAGDFSPIIRQPALFIGGTKDPAFILSGKDPIPAMQAHVPHLQYAMLDGCGHWTQAEQPEAVEQILLPWLEQQKADLFSASSDS